MYRGQFRFISLSILFVKPLYKFYYLGFSEWRRRFRRREEKEEKEEEEEGRRINAFSDSLRSLYYLVTVVMKHFFCKNKTNLKRLYLLIK